MRRSTTRRYRASWIEQSVLFLARTCYRIAASCELGESQSRPGRAPIIASIGIAWLPKMADRGSARGAGSNRGGPSRGGNARGGGPNAARNGPGGASIPDRPKKEAILELSKYRDQRIRVKFLGGREVTGVLKGSDQLMNMVLDDVQELVRDPDTLAPLDPAQYRSLGLTVIRGTAIVVINPTDGQEIANPFVQAEE
ncbi:uncharacterized protein L969DRAFT_50851 [Mixia osmundae IAM 14324]|uniref:uncharacterized protein n=1 Tax=Mixia osmundae (strain CBS 9802 / IAM 14324 / JCM 22182 / KY 12970) TaxID=764103 RepID=UPI0004A549DC|nr:uncharacterized protein L969DRAFT_50851 [Mixia osmundae IAM 14324]KEI38295.1 hypothetical protein L969DRAFT_50851 [Mixia osmundae IAM 14324]